MESLKSLNLGREAPNTGDRLDRITSTMNTRYADAVRGSKKGLDIQEAERVR